MQIIKKYDDFVAAIKDKSSEDRVDCNGPIVLFFHKTLTSVLLFPFLALASCNQVEKPFIQPQMIEETVAPTTEAPVPVEVIPSLPEPSTVSPPVRTTKPVNTRPRVDIDEYNLRGFDPASEDDMYDNGMRRYMENDDDEGWD